MPHQSSSIRKRMTPSDRYPEVLRLHARGFSAKQSAQQLGVAVDTIYRAWAALGLRCPQRQRADALLVEMIKAGASHAEIAAALGVKEHSVAVRANVRGLPSRALDVKREERREIVAQHYAEGLSINESRRRLRTGWGIVRADREALGLVV